MKKEKTWNLAGFIIGLIVICVGIWYMCSPPKSYYTDSVKDRAFGGDYYTYQYEATQVAVNNTATTANNIRELGQKLAVYSGTAFVVCGLLIVLHYGRRLFVSNEQSKLTINEVPTTIEDPISSQITMEEMKP